MKHFDLSRFIRTSIQCKALCIIFDKVYGFIRKYDRTRYIILFGFEKYNIIFNRIKYLPRLNSNISYVISHNYVKIKLDLDDEKTLNMHNAVMPLKSIFNKD